MATFLQSLSGSVPPIPPIAVFRSGFAFAFHRAHNPCSFTGGFSLEGAPFLLQRDHNSTGPFCWSPGTYYADDTFQLRAVDTAFRSTLLVSAFGSISCPPAVLHGPLRSGTSQAPPIRLLRSALSQHAALHISASSQLKPQDRPRPVLFFRASGLRHTYDAPRTSMLESTLRKTSNVDFAC